MRLFVLAIFAGKFIFLLFLPKKANCKRKKAMLVIAAPNPLNVFRTNITPEEAQRYLNSPPFSEPQLSGRTDVLPLVRSNDPRYRSAEAGPTHGHYWKNGREIENTDDYVEEVHDAAQYHGQDGLGAYAYGYKTPQSSKVEKSDRAGEVKGAYDYKAGSGLIKVRYWADQNGFHQEDNLAEWQESQETPENRRARLAHAKAWQEAADGTAHQPDQQREYYHGPDRQTAYDTAPYPNRPYQQDLNGAASEHQGQYQRQQSQQQPQYQAQQGSYQDQQGSQSQQQPQYQAQQGSYQDQQGSQSQQQPQYQAQQGSQARQGSYQAQQGSYQDEQGQQRHYKQRGQAEEGEPRGFFYSYNYPVSTIVAKNAQEQGGSAYSGHPVDHDTVGISAQSSAYAQRG